MDQVPRHGKLRRELKLRDLVLIQFLIVFGINFTGSAAKQGSTQVMLWVAGILGFYAPLSAVVIFFSRAIPLEGGLYQWIKKGVSPFAGFMAAWNYSVFYILLFANEGPAIADSVGCILGSAPSHLTANKPAMIALNAGIWGLVAWVNVRGFHLIKRLSSAASLWLLAMAAIMVALLARKWVSGPLEVQAFSLASPGLSPTTLAVFSKMTILALSGFEGASILAEECWFPERALGIAVCIAAPVIGVLYILCTGAVLAYIQPKDINLVASVPQLLRVGFGSTHWAAILGTAAIIGSVVIQRIQMATTVGMVGRLPMVAGWDGSLPAWWSELHPRYSTPYKALAVLAAVAVGIGIISLYGADEQEAVQVTTCAAAASLCLVYLMLFGLVAVGIRRFRPPNWLRLAGLAGFCSVAVALVSQLFPLVAVTSRWGFALKVGGCMTAINLAGAGIYHRGALRSAMASAGWMKSRL